ncbi:MAG: T9SS type A sorting domain-containing protein, partial [Bacteroidota bacterium]
TSPENASWEGFVFENETEDYTFSNSTFERCGIQGYAHYLNINSCQFTHGNIEFSAGKLQIENSQFDEAFVNAKDGLLVQPVNIFNCTFNNENIFDYPIKIDNYKLFDIHGNNIKHNDKTGIAIYNSKGAKGAEVHDIYNNEIYSKTAGSGNADFGIRVYNSHVDLKDNNNIYNNFVGLICYNTSEVTLLGDCNAQDESTAQKIKNNSLRQVYTDDNSFPTDFRYNVIYDDNASTYYVYYERAILPPSPDTYITENYWGTSFAPENNLYPASSFIYEPIWNFGCLKDGPVQSQYDSAIIYVSNGNFSLAEQLFKEIVLNYPQSIYAKASLKELFALKDIYDQDYAGLKSFYDTTFVLQDTTEISKLAYWLSNKCDVRMGNYQAAITWYENIIDNPDTENDSVFAIIDLGYTYILMEDSTQRQQIFCKYPEYNFPNRKSYELFRDELLDRLWDDESATVINENQFVKDSYFEELSIYPNPVKGVFSIKFVLKQDVFLGLRIYDNTGRLIFNTDSNIFKKGENNLQVDFSGFPKGIYSCTLVVNDYSISKKLIKF